MTEDGLMTTCDEALVADLKKGDERAMSPLMDRYMGFVYGMACRYLGDREEAADVAQEVFIKVYRHIDKFTEKSKFSTWIYRIAINTSIAALRSRNRRAEHQAESLDATPLDDTDLPQRQTEAKGRNAREKLEDKEWDGILQDRLLELPESYRMTFILREMRQMSYEEIAESMSVPIGTVRSRLHQARMRLRELLKPWLEEKSPSPKERTKGDHSWRKRMIEP